MTKFNGPYKMVPKEDWNCNQGEMTLMLQRNTEGETQDTVWYVCPCGCNGNTALTINGFKNDVGASWKFSVDENGLPTISPSIHASKSCGAHYYIRNGMVQWC